MTNLQEGAPRFSATFLRRLWLWGPIAAAGALAALLAATVLAPLWVSLQRDSQRLREVQALTDRLADERLRSKRLLEQGEKVSAQRNSLVRLISGNGDISTFLAKLDQMARGAGVQLDLYEPKAAMVEADPKKDGQAGAEKSQQKPPVDPLGVEGMERHSLLMSARGDFTQLLSFLRQLEALNVLVVQSDLQLNLEPQTGAPALPIAPEPVVMKMALSLYSKVDKPAPSKPPANAAAPTPAATN
jgi:hypothetical protein